MTGTHTDVDELLDHDAGLTKNQLLILVGQEAAPDKPLFNELSVFVLPGRLDVSRFHAAFARMLAESDALRTTIRWVQGRPRAHIHDELAYESDVLDLSGRADVDDELHVWARQYVDAPIDLTQRPFESTLVKLADDRYAWALRVHQVLTDATSVAIAFHRVGDWYQRLSPEPERMDASSEAIASSEPAPSYQSYIQRQIRDRDKPTHPRRAAYWGAKVADPAPPIVYYGEKSISTVRSGHRERIDRSLGPDLTAAVRAFAQSDGVQLLSDHLSSFSVFSAALIAYLHRLSGNERITIGTPWQNRPKAFHSTIGLFMEQNPFEVHLAPDETFRTLLKKVQAEAIGTLRHLPYAAGNPGGRVYDVTLNYVKTTLGSFAGIPVDHRWYRPSIADGSMQLQVHDVGERQDVTVSFDLSTEIFTGAERERVVAHYLACLTELITAPDQPLSGISLMTDRERALLGQWNDTARDYPRERTVVDLIQTQAARRPDAVAAAYGDEQITYAQLIQRVNALAMTLRAGQVGPGVIVGVLLDRSLDLLVALLAVLRAGGAYLPLDPSHPRDRVDGMLDDSGATVVVTQSQLAGRFSSAERGVITLDRLAAQATPDDIGAWPQTDPEDLAYLLYTSGSTGRPKGVQVPHRALTNFLCAMADQPGCSSDDVLLAVTTPSFDIAGLELFLPLTVGGRVEIASREVAADGRLLRARLEHGDITMMQATPVTWRMLVDAGWAATPDLTALIGGEALPGGLIQPLLERTAALWNMYGPTETTIWSSLERITTARAEVTVGRPIANTGFHIVDAQLQPVPIGIAGELLISGDGVAQGYHGRPELTDDRFIDVALPGAPASMRVFRTGDRAMFRDDGRVVHLGRLDQQVKINGFRIEPGEIESLLGQHALVRHAVVVAHGTGTAAAGLVAYVVPSQAAVPSAPDLRQHLRASLPEYMVPRLFVPLPELPLTLNGKVDRLRLPIPDTPGMTLGTDDAPSTPMETRVAAAFCEVLALPSVGVDLDFFDLGGQSVLALRLAALLSERLGVDVALHLLFEASTVRSLSRRLDVLAAGGEPAPPVGETADLDRRVRDVWRSALGREPSGVAETSLTDAQVIDLLVRVREEFGVPAEGISAMDFRADPTVAGLKRALHDAFNPPQTLVVPLQPHGDREPLFLIHAGGGYVFSYRALAARLGPHRPVYAIRATTPRDDEALSFDRVASIEELAARYITDIKTIQPEGPYHLGGACFGGVVAFEMAQQLRHAGDVVGGPVLLFDAFVGKLDEGWREYASRTLDSVAQWVGADRSVGVAELMRGIAVHAVTRPVDVLTLMLLTGRSLHRRARTRLRLMWADIRQRSRDSDDAPRSPEQEQLDTIGRFLAASIRLVTKYGPRPYAGSAVLVKASVGIDPEPLWRPWIDDGLEVHVAPGEHLDMMEEPWVERTAEIVRSALEGEGQAVDAVSSVGLVA